MRTLFSLVPLSLGLVSLALSACGGSSPSSSGTTPATPLDPVAESAAPTETLEPETPSVPAGPVEFVLLDSGLGQSPESAFVHEGEIVCEFSDGGDMRVLRNDAWEVSEDVTRPRPERQLGWESDSDRPEAVHRDASGQTFVAGHAGERAVIWRVGVDGTRTELFDASPMGDPIRWIGVAGAGDRVVALANIVFAESESWSVFSIEGETVAQIRGGQGSASSIAGYGEHIALVQNYRVGLLHLPTGEWSEFEAGDTTFFNVLSDAEGLVAFGEHGLIAVTGNRGAGVGVPASESQAQRYIALARSLGGGDPEAIRRALPEGTVTMVAICSVCDTDEAVSSELSADELVVTLNQQRDRICEGVHETEENRCSLFTPFESVSCEGECCRMIGGFSHSQPSLTKVCAEEREGELRLTRIEIAES